MKVEDDIWDSKGSHGVNTRPWRPHTTRIELIDPNTGILISKEASLIEDSRPLPRKTRPIDFQKWVKKFDENGDPFKHMPYFRQVLEAEVVHD